MADERAGRSRPHLQVVQVPSRRAEAMHAARVTVLLLLAPTAVLTVLGLAMIMSAGSVSATQGYDGNPFWYFQRQGIYAIVGVAALLVAVRHPAHRVEEAGAADARGADAADADRPAPLGRARRSTARRAGSTSGP